MTRTQTKNRLMGMSLAEFSRRLDGITDLDGSQGRGELYGALVAEAAAKPALALLERDKEIAMDWLEAYRGRGIAKDNRVSTDMQFTYVPSATKPEHLAVSAARLKKAKPEVYERARIVKNYRKVEVAEQLVAAGKVKVDLLPTVPQVLPKYRGEWAVTWGQAFHRYQDRLAQMKPLKEAVAHAGEASTRLLESYIDEGWWDGIETLEFTCGSTLSMKRREFDQDTAKVILDEMPDGGLFIDFVPAKTPKPSRRIMRIGYERAGEAELTEAAAG